MKRHLLWVLCIGMLAACGSTAPFLTPEQEILQAWSGIGGEEPNGLCMAWAAEWGAEGGGRFEARGYKQNMTLVELEEFEASLRGRGWNTYSQLYSKPHRAGMFFIERARVDTCLFYTSETSQGAQ